VRRKTISFSFLACLPKRAVKLKYQTIRSFLLLLLLLLLLLRLQRNSLKLEAEGLALLTGSSQSPTKSVFFVVVVVLCVLFRYRRTHTGSNASQRSAVHSKDRRPSSAQTSERTLVRVAASRRESARPLRDILSS
jgi:hypothetical protein